MDYKRHPGHGGQAGKGPTQLTRGQATALVTEAGGRGYEDDIVRRECGTGPPSGARGNTAHGTVIAADRLVGTPVYGSGDELLGRVSHVLVDLAEECIAFIVIELKEAAGGTLCAVPWTALDVDPGIPRFSLTQTADDMNRAPTFDSTHWPPMADAVWLRRVHLFFDCLPYWVPKH